MRDQALTILPTHRLVRRFPPVRFLELEKTMERSFEVQPYPKTREGRREFLRSFSHPRKGSCLLGASFARDPRLLLLRFRNRRELARRASDLCPELRELDVVVLHRIVLEGILGIPPEEQLHPDVLGYTEDAEEALRAVEAGECQAAFLVHAPRPEQILAVAERGEKMPQKSTYFYPKLPSGLVLRRVDPEEEVG
jgi:hypothetical protein